METFVPRGNIYGPILPQFVLEKSITLGAKVMYAILCNYASERDHCWPSQATLAARLSCSISSVKKYLGELVNERLIEVQNEKCRSSIYYMLRPAALLSKQSTTVHTQSNSGSAQPKNGYLNTLNKESKNTNPPLPPKSAAPKQAASASTPAAGGVSSFAHDFERLWAMYPKKEAKGFALNAWNLLRKKGELPSIADLQRSIEQFMGTESWQREQGRFIPHFGNWLRGQRWLDSAISPKTELPQTNQPVTDARCKAFLDGEERIRQERQKERDTLRPSFEAFAAQFKEQGLSFHEPMAFGLWMYLHSKQCAPAASDVPEDNSLGIIDFLEAHKRNKLFAKTAKQPLPQANQNHSTTPTLISQSGFFSHCGDALRNLGFGSGLLPTRSALCGAGASL